MKILFTNIIMVGRSGSELFTEALADSFRERGHETAVYTPVIGELGHSLIRRGIPVFDDIASMNFEPDIIHGHHNAACMTAIAAFPDKPAVFVSHSVEAEFDRPPLHNNILRYFTVSSLIPSRWATRDFPAGRFEWLGNAVNLNFLSRKSEPPRHISTALVVAKNTEGAAEVLAFCNERGLSVTGVGAGFGNVVQDLRPYFAEADVVFASGRTAMEALASGCAVILADGGRFLDRITSNNVKWAYERNFGVAALNKRFSIDLASNAFDGYEADDAVEVTNILRSIASLEAQIDLLQSAYTDAIEQFAEDGPASNNSVARFIQDYVPRFGRNGNWLPLTQYVASYAISTRGAALGEPQSSRYLSQEHHAFHHFHDQGTPATLEDAQYCCRLILKRYATEEEWLEALRLIGGPLTDLTSYFHKLSSE